MTTVVIGAGIAGLSAGYHLHQAGEPVIVLEARDRIGGRVHTLHDFASHPVEAGAELIHGHHVIVHEWVKRLNLTTVHWAKVDDSMVRLEDGRWLTMRQAREQSPEFDLTRSWELPDVPVKGGDEDLKSYLVRLGFTMEQLRYVERSFANAVGDAMRFISAEAILQELNHDAPPPPPDLHPMASGDYRIVQGYSAFYEALAEGLDIRLSQMVTAIEWSDESVRIVVKDNEVISTDRVVITLPAGVLKAGTVRFDPQLPDFKQQAIKQIRMGPVMKMLYVFDAPISDPAIAAIYSRGNPPMWWSPSYQRETDQQVWTAFFSGDHARELLAMGEDAALQQGLSVLAEELGLSDLKPARARWVNWVEDPFSQGGYSVTPPGASHVRADLARPTPPLYWAGEAAAPHHMAATVHGAYETGKQAAQAVLASIE